ncbi:Uncharacterised protein [Mycobacteroides abscessus subsp. abscessus]|nr:Uncharacterised protein [Mycobacteroides abscessus subsp. abscessus]
MEGNVLSFRRDGGTGWPTVDSGGVHGGEELPVESCVAGLNGPVAGLRVKLHDLSMPGPWRRR